MWRPGEVDRRGMSSLSKSWFTFPEASKWRLIVVVWWHRRRTWLGMWLNENKDDLYRTVSTVAFSLDSPPACSNLPNASIPIRHFLSVELVCRIFKCYTYFNPYLNHVVLEHKIMWHYIEGAAPSLIRHHRTECPRVKILNQRPRHSYFVIRESRNLICTILSWPLVDKIRT